MFIDLVAPHPQYNPQTADHDLALVKTKKIYGKSADFIQLADRPADSMLAPAGAIATVTGWGQRYDKTVLEKIIGNSRTSMYLSQDELNDVFSPTILQEAQIKIIDQKVCKDKFGVTTAKS